MVDPNMEAFEHWCDTLNEVVILERIKTARNAALEEAACLAERMAKESDHPRMVGSIVFRTNCQRIAKEIRKLMMSDPKYGNAGDIEQTMARHEREAAGAAVWVMNRCVCCEGELQVGDAVELRANGRAAHAACTIAEELRAGGGER